MTTKTKINPDKLLIKNLIKEILKEEEDIILDKKKRDLVNKAKKANIEVLNLLKTNEGLKECKEIVIKDFVINGYDIYEKTIEESFEEYKNTFEDISKYFENPTKYFENALYGLDKNSFITYYMIKDNMDFINNVMKLNQDFQNNLLKLI